MAKYDAVLMDFYGTLADGDGHAINATCGRIVREHQLSLNAEELAKLWGRSFFAIVDESNHESFRTLHECECVSLRQTLRDLGRDCDPRPYADELQLYWQNPPLHADAKEALQRLDVPVCCVSNADEVDVRSAIARHGLGFHAVVSSEQARCYKPHRGIFEYAARLMGAAPQRCVHVGDSLHSDINGAQALGMTTVWVQRDRRISDIGTCRPDHTVRSLAELERVLAEFG